MGKVVRPVFGRPCHECGEQIPMSRVRIIEADLSLNGRMAFNMLCVDCQCLRENEERRLRRAEGARDVVILRG